MKWVEGVANTTITSYAPMVLRPIPSRSNSLQDQLYVSQKPNVDTSAVAVSFCLHLYFFRKKEFASARCVAAEAFWTVKSNAVKNRARSTRSFS